MCEKSAKASFYHLVFCSGILELRRTILRWFFSEFHSFLSELSLYKEKRLSWYWCHSSHLAKKTFYFWEIGKVISCDKAPVKKAHILYSLYFLFHTYKQGSIFWKHLITMYTRLPTEYLIWYSYVLYVATDLCSLHHCGYHRYSITKVWAASAGASAMCGREHLCISVWYSSNWYGLHNTCSSS